MLCSQKTSLLKIAVMLMKGRSMEETGLKTYCVPSEHRLVPDLHNLDCVGYLTFTLCIVLQLVQVHAVRDRRSDSSPGLSVSKPRLPPGQGADFPCRGSDLLSSRPRARSGEAVTSRPGNANPEPLWGLPARAHGGQRPGEPPRASCPRHP